MAKTAGGSDSRNPRDANSELSCRRSSCSIQTSQNIRFLPALLSPVPTCAWDSWATDRMSQIPGSSTSHLMEARRTWPFPEILNTCKRRGYEFGGLLQPWATLMTLGTRRILHLDDGPESITNGIPNQKLRRLGEQHESPPEDLKCDGYFTSQQDLVKTSAVWETASACHAGVQGSRSDGVMRRMPAFPNFGWFHCFTSCSTPSCTQPERPATSCLCWVQSPFPLNSGLSSSWGP